MAHIIIIGAGASGLMAASLLIEQNHTLTLLEARDRTGGRIHTLQTEFSIPLDIGAEFIHGQQPVTLSLLKQAGYEPLPITGHYYQHLKGQWQEANFMDDAWRDVGKALHLLKTEMTMATFLDQYFSDDQYADLRDRVKRYIEGYDIADLDRVSARAIKAEWEASDDEQQYHLAEGYGVLINYLEQRVRAAGGNIVCSSPVKKIEWSAGNVTIHSAQDTVTTGDKVIITVPLGVLQQKSIVFSPPLPEHDQALSRMGYGGVIKFLIEFKRPFWEELKENPLTDLAFILSDETIPTWWTPLPAKAPILTGWLGGPSTFTCSTEVTELYALAITSLQSIFNLTGAEIQHEIKHWHIINWVTDPYSRGAYAYATTDTHQALTVLSKPVHNTLYFAGEALYDGPAMGTVEAALVSGKNVAAQIKEALP